MVFEGKILNDKSSKIPYSEVSKNPMQLLLPDNEAYQIINNTNIINQKGLFFITMIHSYHLKKHTITLRKILKIILGKQNLINR